MSKPMTAMIIMDGFGIDPNVQDNAIIAAGTPNLDALMAAYPHTQIGASGLDVGLPDGQMGNSEVGHTNIGAGRVVYQMLVKITKDIQDGVFFENKALLGAMENCKANDSALHLIGLVSPGGVHSHTEHLYGLLEMAKKNGVSKVYVHALLDGRDYVSPEDVQKMAPPVLAHRLVLSPEARMRNMTAERVLQSVLQGVQVPVKVK